MYQDFIFGPLNPLLFAIYQTDVELLEELLDKYQYPTTISGYLSPLSFAFKLKSNSIIKVLCDKLSNRDYKVNFTRIDFHFLLNSNQNYCHNLLCSIIQENSLENFPKILSIEQDSSIFFYKDIKQILSQINNSK
jgi:hypothetical protein